MQSASLATPSLPTQFPVVPDPASKKPPLYAPPQAQALHQLQADTDALLRELQRMASSPQESLAVEPLAGSDR
jgi:hypothetical protein